MGEDKKCTASNVDNIVITAQSMIRDYVVSGDPNARSDPAAAGTESIVHHHYKLQGLIQQQQEEANGNNDDNNNKNPIDPKDDDELQEWAEFCASVFAYKPNPPPPAYFLRHYNADPDRVHPSLIRIARYIGTNIVPESSGTIVASCRLFYKTISTGKNPGSYIIAGGIGEVCTSTQHRRRGLSKELLNDCISLMIPSTFHVSILHAAPSFFPVYQASGYCNYVPTYNSWITISIPNLVVDPTTTTNTDEGTSSKTKIRLAQFPNDTEQLQRIHKEYSEDRFIGCIVRSIDYWNSYISQELHNTLYVLAEEADHDELRGWLSIRQRGGDGCYQVRDFGCSSIPDAGRVFRTLLQNFVHQNNLKQETESIQLQLPTPILHDIQQGNDDIISNEVTEEDMGWMYRPVLEHTDADNTVENEAFSIAALDKLFNKDKPHLIWSADSF